MKPVTSRGLQNAMSLLFSSPEFNQIRLFLVADASSDKPEAEEFIKTVVDQIRAHLLDHSRQTKVIAAQRRAV